jgi:hypothetical protein
MIFLTEKISLTLKKDFPQGQPLNLAFAEDTGLPTTPSLLNYKMF